MKRGKRIAIKCKDACNVVAPCINFDEVAAKKVQETEEDINKDCASKLSVRFHTDALKHSLESNYFDKRAEGCVKQLLDNLENLKANISVWHLKRKKANEEKDKSKQRTLFSYFQGKMEKTTESAASCESSFLDSDCL